MLCGFQVDSGFGFIFRILAAPPTAELEPLTDGQVSQTDEVRHGNVYVNYGGHADSRPILHT